MEPETAGAKENLRRFRLACFAGAYLGAALITGVLGGCFFPAPAEWFSYVWLLYAFFFFPMSLHAIGGVDLGRWGPLPYYLAIALVGIFDRSIRLFRVALAVFVSLLILNIASCISMGGCFRGA